MAGRDTSTPEALLEAEAGIATDVADLVDRLGLAILLREDEGIGERLGGDRPLAVRVPAHHEAWVLVRGEPAVVRGMPHGMATADLQLVARRDPGLRGALDAAARRVGSHVAARALLEPFLAPRRVTDRSDLAALAPYLPAIEDALCRVAARSLALVDALRGHVTAEIARGGGRQWMKRYWAAQQLMARTTLLSSDPVSGGWLVAMARSFEWVHWSPSRPLVRERGLWMAAVGMRAAIAYGPGIVDLYLSRLTDSDALGAASDAVLGLVAIGCGHPGEAQAIRRAVAAVDVERARWARTGPAYAEALLAHAIAVLERDGPSPADDDAVAGLWRADDRIASPAIRHADPMAFAGHANLALALARTVADADPADFLPVRRRVTSRAATVSEAARLFARAFSGL